MNLRSAFPKTASGKKFSSACIASRANRLASRAASGVWCRRRKSCVGLICYPDHLGTPRAITTSDAANTKVWEWRNDDPFGNNAPNENPGALGNFTYNLRFGGRAYYDQETATMYMYFRDYDPATGRFPQSDPAGLSGGINTYAYVGGKPLSSTDPFGLWSTDAHNYFIRTMFPTLPTGLREAIERGSRTTDNMGYQDACNSHMHAMSSDCLTPEKAREKMCKFVKANLSGYNNLIESKDAASQTSAYFLLGMALHPIMDSTSPVHRGLQQWHTSDWMLHGPWPTSKEDVNTASLTSYRTETLELMRRAMNGDLSLCGCQ